MHINVMEDEREWSLLSLSRSVRSLRRTCVQRGRDQREDSGSRLDDGRGTGDLLAGEKVERQADCDGTLFGVVSKQGDMGNITSEC